MESAKDFKARMHESKEEYDKHKAKSHKYKLEGEKK